MFPTGITISPPDLETSKITDLAMKSLSPSKILLTQLILMEHVYSNDKIEPQLPQVKYHFQHLTLDHFFGLI